MAIAHTHKQRLNNDFSPPERLDNSGECGAVRGELRPAADQQCCVILVLSWRQAVRPRQVSGAGQRQATAARHSTHNLPGVGLLPGQLPPAAVSGEA